MIVSRITAKSQTTVPRAVRAALGVGPEDALEYTIDGSRVVLTRALTGDEGDRLGIGDLSMFTEWADELDAIYDRR